MSLDRNFLHAKSLALTQPRTDEPLSFTTDLPSDLTAFLIRLSGV